MRVLEISLDDPEIGFIVPEGCILFFTQKPTATPKRVLSNFPPHAEDPFDPKVFYPIPPASSGDAVAMLQINRPGFFEFKVDDRVHYFRVDPMNGFGPRGLPVSSFSVQTMVVRCMGPASNWPALFDSTALAGYNAVHLTPIQPPGESGSAYSVLDQLDINPALWPNKETTKAERLAEMKQLLATIRTRTGISLITDVCLPHTANNSPFLFQHPEAGYSLQACPYLKSAFILDMALCQYSLELQRRAVSIQSVLDIDKIVGGFKDKWLSKAKLWEFYVLNVNKELANYQSSDHSTCQITAATLNSAIVRDPLANRFSLGIDWNRLPKIHSAAPSSVSLASVKSLLEVLNLALYKTYDADVEAILRALKGGLLWENLDPNGPKEKQVDFKRYFTILKSPEFDVESVDVSTDVPDDLAAYAVVNHGWVMDGNPSVDFAGPDSKSYLRREVLVWGDCVKLRYGKCYEDNPWLWEHMAEYVTMMATMFDGFRIDNCHSIPLVTLRYLLTKARIANPSLLIFAELFAPTLEALHLFASSTGIHALIREGSHPHSSRELHEFLYTNSGAITHPIGKFSDTITQESMPSRRLKARNYHLTGWVFDQTHDNDPFSQSHTPAHSLASTALVAMCATPVGSCRGFDELLPFKISVVTERRKYRINSQLDKGILAPKGLLGRLHEKLAVDGYSEGYVESHGPLISICRFSPTAFSTYHLIALPSFNESDRPTLPPVRLPGRLAEIPFYCLINVPKDQSEAKAAAETSPFLSGLDCELELKQDVPIDQTNPNHFTIKQCESNIVINFNKFPPGSILCLRCELTFKEAQALSKMDTLIGQISNLFMSSTASLVDMNHLLYRCQNEEGQYDVPGYGKPVYCGLQGWISLLDDILFNYPVDMGHALFTNLRSGNWLMDWMVSRLKPVPSLTPIRNWLQSCFEQVQEMPRYLIPKLFARVLYSLHEVSIRYCLRLMPRHTYFAEAKINLTPLAPALALGSVQLFGDVADAPLIDPKLGTEIGTTSLAAGLPHFASGFMRTWGRDSFISLKGLLLLTGRIQEAKQLLLSGASVVRHGMVPNLFDSGRNPRYNSRDATWWFLNSAMDYCDYVTVAGTLEVVRDLMQTKVKRVFPPSPDKTICTFEDVIQEIMECHASGIEFTEVNAGPKIDDKMQDQGFNIKIWRDPQTGFLHGGNAFNCGTWMDKMGESKKAGNYGVPATPRDGAAVEIIGLLKRVVTGLGVLYNHGLYQYSGARAAHIEWVQWAEQISANFYRCFYVPLDPARDGEFVINKSWVNKRGMFKDTYQSSQGWSDYQLRPNVLVAMSVAPELFMKHKEATSACLDLVTKKLLGPLGMKTLDPDDWAYRGNYDSSDSSERGVAKGFNYHQGPEWLWPFGYYLLALMKHSTWASPELMSQHIIRLLKPHEHHIARSPWKGLPELTNANGEFCPASCACQAWSIATIQEAIYYLYQSTHNK